MSMIFLVVPLALLIALGFLVAFVIAARGGQFDDLDTPPRRILAEDELAPRNSDRSSP